LIYIVLLFSSYRIDASVDEGSHGRMVNDNLSMGNACVKKIIHGNMPHLCFFAKVSISAGDEITYDYGKGDFPWRVKVSSVYLVFRVALPFGGVKFDTFVG